LRKQFLFATGEIERRTITGVGVEVTIIDKHPVISSVLASFPAQESGLQEGDRIISINGNTVKGLEVEKVKQVLNPPAEPPSV